MRSVAPAGAPGKCNSHARGGRQRAARGARPEPERAATPPGRSQARLPPGRGGSAATYKEARPARRAGACLEQRRVVSLREARLRQRQQPESAEPSDGSEHGQQPRQPGCKCRERGRLPMYALFANKGALGGGCGRRGSGQRRGVRGANGQGSALSPGRCCLCLQRFGPWHSCRHCKFQLQDSAPSLGLCCSAVSSSDMWHLCGLRNAGRAISTTGMMRGEEARKFGAI